MSTSQKIILMRDVDGESKPLSAVAKAHGISGGALHYRVWRTYSDKIKAGETIDVTPDLLARKRRTPKLGVYIVDGVEYLSSREAWMKLTWLKNEWSLHNKCRSLGTRVVTKEQILSRKQRGSADEKKDDFDQHEDHHEEIGENWQGLSNTRNTGAGRGEIPDEIWQRDWVGRGKRASNLSNSLLNLPRVTRGAHSDSLGISK